VFLIPAESGEKITLGISTMLNMTVFLMTIMSGLPPNDQTPLISKYQYWASISYCSPLNANPLIYQVRERAPLTDKQQ
jgi:nicotinic acetylcholine receptor